MDRFIVLPRTVTTIALTDLKSSMDRFIVAAMNTQKSIRRYLKSSMDRFIDWIVGADVLLLFAFKIQYG